MAELTEGHEEFLVSAASWIKAHRDKYRPVTAVRYIGNWKELFDELESMGLVLKYKGGETIVVTKWGWRHISNKHPEIARRRTGVIHLGKREP